MKQLILTAALIAAVGLIHCTRQPDATPLTCTGNCLFVAEKATGKIIRMDCFDKFAIETHHPETDSIIYGIPDAILTQYEEVGKKVVFSGIFRANTLTPIFPDPGFSTSSIYQMELVEIR